MPMPKRKPNFNASATMQELLAAVCDFYGDPVDDRTTEDPDHVSEYYGVAEPPVRTFGSIGTVMPQYFAKAQQKGCKRLLFTFF